GVSGYVLHQIEGRVKDVTLRAMADARTYRGATHSERRTRRQAALLDAALDTAAAEGMAAVTVRGVCTRARFNDRYFYESFRTVDDLVAALFDDQIARAFAALLPAIETTPPDPVQ